MDTLVNQFIEVLQMEMAAYQKFASVLEEERAILIKSSEKDIVESAREKTEMIKHIHQMESERKDILMEIEKVSDIAATKLRLKDLIPLLPEEFRSTLLFLREQLISTMDNVKRINEVNRQLTENALKFIDMNVKILLGQPKDENGLYTKKEKNGKHPDSVRRVLDCKI